MQHIPKNLDFWKKLQADFCQGVGFILGKYVSNININHIRIISVNTANLPLILIALAVNTAVSLAVKKTLCISYILL